MATKTKAPKRPAPKRRVTVIVSQYVDDRLKDSAFNDGITIAAEAASRISNTYPPENG